jgi:hypothetical protein
MSFSRADAPPWLLSVLLGSSFAVLFGLASVVLIDNDDGIAGMTIGAVIAGCFFGAVMGPLVARERDRLAAQVGPLPKDTRRAIGRASERGPVPADPEVRAAAYRLVLHRIDQQRRLRTLTILGFGALAVTSVAGAVTSAARWEIPAALTVLLAVSTVYQHRSLRRRAALLRPPDDDDR